MSKQLLIESMNQQNFLPREDLIALWTGETSLGETDDFVYGAFVDDTGLICGLGDGPLVSLRSDDPRALETDSQFYELCGRDISLVFIDWIRQDLGWEEICELWDVWTTQGMIANCGPVAVSWDLRDRWGWPGWIAFHGAFDGAPLTTVGKEEKFVEPRSLLARARLRRPSSDLPQIPFTLENLKDPHFAWPEGVA